jgi:hypothetical protein
MPAIPKQVDPQFREIIRSDVQGGDSLGRGVSMGRDLSHERKLEKVPDDFISDMEAQFAKSQSREQSLEAKRSMEVEIEVENSREIDEQEREAELPIEIKIEGPLGKAIGEFGDHDKQQLDVIKENMQGSGVKAIDSKSSKGHDSSAKTPDKNLPEQTKGDKGIE